MNWNRGTLTNVYHMPAAESREPTTAGTVYQAVLSSTA